MVHYSISVTGKVQGVFFRKYTKEEADRLGVRGLVRNEPDGSVYIEAEGDEHNVDKFIKWCWKGSPSSKVDNVTIKKTDLAGYSDFSVIR
jgi:acylphosphatase